MLDAVVCLCLETELAELVGFRVTSAGQPSPYEVQLGLRRQDGVRSTLVLSCHPRWARIHTTPQPADNTNSHFSTICEHHLVGGVIQGISTEPWERIITISLVRRDLVRDSVPVTIVTEMMGKHSNVLLVADSGRILDAVKRVGPDQSRVRQVHPGVHYLKPPPRAGLPPPAWRPRPADTDQTVTRWLIREIAGMSPLWATELCARAHLSGDASARELSDDQLLRLGSQLSEMCGDIAEKRFRPTGYRSDDGTLVSAWAFPLIHASGHATGDLTMNELLRDLYCDLDMTERLTSQRQRVISAIGREMDHRTQTREDSLSAAAEEGDPELCRRHGELLTAYAHSVSSGPTVAELPDFDDPTLIHHIPLAPDRSAIDTARELFRRYRRLTRRRATRQRQLDAMSIELASLQGLLDRAITADTYELAAIHSQLSRGTERRRRVPAAPAADCLRLKSPGGLEILVGRNNRQNDIVTFGHAQEFDLWFHVQGLPGAHVILRLPGPGFEPSPECLEFAAGLAAHFSEARHATAAAVDVVARRRVRRRPGAGPGQVLYDGYRTYHVRPRPPGD